MTSKTKIKGVILAAGYGSRFFPATKTTPKEMFPLMTKPAIQIIIDEFIQAGIVDILIITSRRKKSLEDYFDREIELETAFQSQPDKLSKIAPPKANITFVRQQEMKGTGDALALVENFAGDDPFVVAYPDDLVLGEVSLSKQLIDVYIDSGKNVLAVQGMPDEDVSKYGVVDPAELAGDNVYRINQLVEKPPTGEEPSKMVSVGRYLFTPEIFSVIKDLIDQPREGEFYQTEIINVLAKIDRVVALDFEGDRFDTGDPLGYLKTTICYAMQDIKLKQQILPFLEEIVEREMILSSGVNQSTSSNTTKYSIKAINNINSSNQVDGIKEKEYETN